MDDPFDSGSEQDAPPPDTIWQDAQDLDLGEFGLDSPPLDPAEGLESPPPMDPPQEQAAGESKPEEEAEPEQEAPNPAPASSAQVSVFAEAAVSLTQQDEPILRAAPRRTAVRRRKALAAPEPDAKPLPENWACVRGVGLAFDKNPRFRRTMEDSHAAQDGFRGQDDAGFFAVYDGHGGREAADVAATVIHQLLEQQLADPDISMISALSNSFKASDAILRDQAVLYSGCTAIVAVLSRCDSGRLLSVANAGDARAVLCQGGLARRLSFDHKGSVPEEVRRVTDAGGFVVGGRVNGVLAVTRSLGDVMMRPYVSAEPFTSELVLTAADTFLILACDGLWDVVTDQEAIDFVLDGSVLSHAGWAQRASEQLLRLALDRGSTDNVSVMVVLL